MGKTFRRDQAFRPKKHGRVFVKEKQPWKKNKSPNFKPYEGGNEPPLLEME